jgi:hypothetical protein
MNATPLDWGIIAAYIGIAFTLSGGIFLFGRLAQQLKMIDDRFKEEREKNMSEHKEFYSVKESLIRMMERFETLFKEMDEMKQNIKEITFRLPYPRRRQSDIEETNDPS